MMKYCNRCKCNLPLELFTLRNKGGKMRCKPCKNEITRDWCRRKAQERMSELAPKFKGLDLVGQCIARWYA